MMYMQVYNGSIFCMWQIFLPKFKYIFNNYAQLCSHTVIMWLQYASFTLGNKESWKWAHVHEKSYSVALLLKITLLSI